MATLTIEDIDIEDMVRDTINEMESDVILDGVDVEDIVRDTLKDLSVKDWLQHVDVDEVVKDILTDADMLKDIDLSEMVKVEISDRMLDSVTLSLKDLDYKVKRLEEVTDSLFSHVHELELRLAKAAGQPWYKIW